MSTYKIIYKDLNGGKEKKDVKENKDDKDNKDDKEKKKEENKKNILINDAAFLKNHYKELEKSQDSSVPYLKHFYNKNINFINKHTNLNSILDSIYKNKPQLAKLFLDYNVDINLNNSNPSQKNPFYYIIQANLHKDKIGYSFVKKFKELDVDINGLINQDEGLIDRQKCKKCTPLIFACIRNKTKLGNY